MEYFNLSLKYGHVFKAGIGAEAIRRLLEEIDLEKEIEKIEKSLQDDKSSDKKRMLKRLKLFQGMKQSGIRPEWMLPTVIPVIPPDLRPMVQLDGGRFATSDLNDLYRRIINRNNRLKKLIEIGAPEVIARNEKRMLQEAVDALFDNSAPGAAKPRLPLPPDKGGRFGLWRTCSKESRGGSGRIFLESGWIIPAAASSWSVRGSSFTSAGFPKKWPLNFSSLSSSTILLKKDTPTMSEVAGKNG